VINRIEQAKGCTKSRVRRFKKEERMSKRVAIFLGIAGLVTLSAIMIRAGVVDLSPTAFDAQDHSSDFKTGWAGWGDYLYRKTGATEVYAEAPINIPHSVLIRYVRFHYMENDASHDVYMALIRTNKYTGQHYDIYGFWTSGASSSITYGTDFSAYPSPSYALTNIEACTYHAGIYCTPEGEDSFKFYGMTIVYDPYP
jgi:hypothetical protein